MAISTTDKIVVNIKIKRFEIFSLNHIQIKPKNVAEIKVIIHASFIHKFHLKLFTNSVALGFWLLNGAKLSLNTDSIKGLPTVNTIKNNPIKLDVIQNHRGIFSLFSSKRLSIPKAANIEILNCNKMSIICGTLNLLK